MEQDEVYLKEIAEGFIRFGRQAKDMFELKVKAPEFEGIAAWINSAPLTMEKLRGKVVLVDFWTYTCINCLRSLPYLKRLHGKYSKAGLVIIGVHSPEFSFEKDVENVRRAVKELGIPYPVAVDSGLSTWNSYANSYWPTKYIIDRDGHVAHVHLGEGGYSDIESRLQAALGVKGDTGKDDYPTGMQDQSPETYLGFIRNSGLGSGLACDADGCNVYIDAGEHERDTVYPNGQWEQETEFLELKKAPGQLAYRFNARQVNVVMGPAGGNPAAVRVIVDGKEAGAVKVDGYRMYTVYEEKKYGEHELVLLFDAAVRVYAYTFG
jgi:thiol-disulfide isomerase/thioredoxin